VPNYTVRKRLVAIGRDYDVKDENGELAFTLDGKVRFARTFFVKDPSGARLLKVREKLLCLDPTFVITPAAGGAPVATVKRTTPSGKLTTKFDVAANGQTIMTAQGRLLTDGGFEIRRGGAQASTVSRQPNTVIHEIFHVTTAASEDQPLLLGVAMSIVEMCFHRGEEHTD
jgi:uncharacterized protein YxjI